jgi:hypothetical protein
MVRLIIRLYLPLTFNADLTVLREATKLALNISTEQPIAKLIAAKQFPPSEADSDLDTWTQQTLLVSCFLREGPEARSKLVGYRRVITPSKQR